MLVWLVQGPILRTIAFGNGSLSKQDLEKMALAY